MAMRIDVKGSDDVVKELHKITRGAALAARDTMLSMGARKSAGAKTAADQEARKVYNIKKADINAKYKGHTETGSETVAGVKIPSFRLEFEQRGTFTPVHFGMKMSGRGRNKTVKWQPLKAGGLVPLKSSKGFPVFLAAPKGVMLPWARLQQKSWVKARGKGSGYRGTGWKHLPVEVIHTHLSTPQMIDNEKVDPNKRSEIERRMEKTLDEKMKKYLK